MAAARRRGRRPRAGADLLLPAGLVLLGRDPGGRPGQQGAGPAGARHRGPGRRRRLGHLARDPLATELTLPAPGVCAGRTATGGSGPSRAQGPDRVERRSPGWRGPRRPARGRPSRATPSRPTRPWPPAGRPTRSPTSPLGPAAAWRVGGRRDTWVILVHGYNAARTETLRTLATVSQQGYPALAITYRIDPGAPRSPTACAAGGDRVRDLEAATRYALERQGSAVRLRLQHGRQGPASCWSRRWRPGPGWCWTRCSSTWAR